MSACSASAALIACRMEMMSRGPTPSAFSPSTRCCSETPSWITVILLPLLSSIWMLVRGTTSVVPVWEKGEGWLTCGVSVTLMVRLPWAMAMVEMRTSAPITITPLFSSMMTVIIDENSGVIVMGADVRISTIAIAQGNLTIKVTETPQVSQPSPFSQTGTTQVVPRTNIQIDDSKGNKMTVMSDGVSLQHLVDGLNALGVGPRDIISILQAIKAAGALQADIQVIG